MNIWIINIRISGHWAQGRKVFSTCEFLLKIFEMFVYKNEQNYCQQKGLSFIGLCQFVSQIYWHMNSVVLDVFFSIFICLLLSSQSSLITGLPWAMRLQISNLNSPSSILLLLKFKHNMLYNNANSIWSVKCEICEVIFY